MTNEERLLITACPAIIISEVDFIIYVKNELEHIGFKDIYNVAETNSSNLSYDKGIIIERLEETTPLSTKATDIPIIYELDFIEGAAAIVVFPEDE